MGLTIWHISKYVIPPSSGSVGSRGFLILRELARMGHTCLMITSDSNHLATPPVLDGPTLKQTVDGVDVHWLRTRKYRGAKSVGRILSWIDFEWRLFRFRHGDLSRPDVIIVSSLSLLTVLNGLHLRRRYRCKLIFEVRDIWPLTITEEGGFSPANPFVMGLAAIEKLGYQHADAIVGTMPNLAEHVSRVLGRQKTTYCVPMGVDPTLLEDAAPLSDGYVEAHIPNGKFIVCHAGTIGATNGLETLLACAEEMRADPRVHFLVVGEGDLKETYRNRCADLPNITFAPGVPKAMVQSVLARCDLLYFSVLPSKVWQFGLSLNKVIDYMLAGRPIVGSYSGHPSMITEAECGSFVPAGDVPALAQEIARFAAMPSERRAEMGRRGRDWLLENRTFPALAENYLDIMRAILKGAG